MAEARNSVGFHARFHCGPPLFGYSMAFALIGLSGYVRLLLLRHGDPRAPFFLFYPAIATAAFFGGAGPGLAAITASAVFGYFVFPFLPPLGSWIALAVLGLLITALFAHLGSLRIRSAEMAREFARFQLISEHVSDWIFLTGESGRIGYVNQTACTALDRTSAELVGGTLQGLAPEAEQAALREVMANCKPGTSLNLELTLARRDGSGVPLDAVFTCVRAVSETVIHVAAREIAERRMIEQKLRDARQWESLGVMAGGLAHDFNNLLTSIMGNASLAKDSLPEDHPMAPLLDNVERAGERCAELVRLMLATAGYRPRYIEKLRIDRLLTDLLATRVIPEHVRVITDIEAPVLPGDERSIVTLLWSLISNAIEAYGEAPGEVRITIEQRAAASRRLPPASFEEGELKPGDFVAIVVEDFGCGMPPEVLERAFDPFYSTKFTGRGLGLPAVRGIVRAYFGRLWLRTKPGEGTRIEVWLPCSTEHS